MHPYATNCSERRIVIAVLVIASILLAYGLSWLISKFQITFQISLWWLDTPAVFGFYGILYTLFDRWLWKAQILRTLYLVKVPDLNGTWNGEARSSHQEFAAPHTVTLKIDQTWTELCASLRGQHSDSESVVAAVLFPKPGEVVLTYQYRNEPRAQALKAMHAHRGTAWLCFRQDGSEDYLEGEYYSGRGRQNIGSLNLRRNIQAQSQTAAAGH